MSLLFGNLTNAFVNFGTAQQEAAAGNTTAKNELPAAADSFRRTAASDASYLVYIGMHCVSSRTPMDAH